MHANIIDTNLAAIDAWLVQHDLDVSDWFFLHWTARAQFEATNTEDMIADGWWHRWSDGSVRDLPEVS